MEHAHYILGQEYKYIIINILILLNKAKCLLFKESTWYTCKIPKILKLKNKLTLVILYVIISVKYIEKEFIIYTAPNVLPYNGRYYTVDCNTRCMAIKHIVVCKFAHYSITSNIYSTPHTL